MPALTMRGRYLMREYWSDTDLFTRLDADQRELYQGLWMLADDDGFLPRDLDGIGAALYRFMDRGDRIAKIRSGLARLRDIGKLESYRCGCLYLPAVARYPRAGKKSTEHSQKHQNHSNRFDDSDSKHQKDLNQTKSIQTDLNASPVPTSSLPDPSSRARANGAPPRSEFQEKVPRPFVVVGKPEKGATA
jgi:hypothetical protein